MTDSPAIFGSGNERYGNATLGFAADPWHLYAYGFRRAVELLLDHVERRHTSLDVIVYPIVFLYRHHLELAIKLVSRHARDVLGDPRLSSSEHRLAGLWRDARQLLIRIALVEPAGLEPITSVVHELDKIDPGASAFRYTESLRHAPLLEGITNINLLIFRESIEPAADMLDCIHTDLAERLEHAYGC